MSVENYSSARGELRPKVEGLDAIGPVELYSSPPLAVEDDLLAFAPRNGLTDDHRVGKEFQHLGGICLGTDGHHAQAHVEHPVHLFVADPAFFLNHLEYGQDRP